MMQPTITYTFDNLFAVVVPHVTFETNGLIKSWTFTPRISTAPTTWTVHRYDNSPKRKLIRKYLRSIGRY